MVVHFNQWDGSAAMLERRLLSPLRVLHDGNRIINREGTYGDSHARYAMIPVEIEAAVSESANEPFDKEEFAFAFLMAFGNKKTTIKRLRSGETNKSDMGGVLQTNNIHIAVAQPGEVTKTLVALKASPATIRAKARYILATDGVYFEAEVLESGETVACAYEDFPDHFGFFLRIPEYSEIRACSVARMSKEGQASFHERLCFESRSLLCGGLNDGRNINHSLMKSPTGFAYKENL